MQMKIEEINKAKQQVYQIAAKHGISKGYVFGSVARGESNDISDIDILIEKDDNASAFGVGAFLYEIQQLLGIDLDIIPTIALPEVEDQDFIKSVQREAVAL